MQRKSRKLLSILLALAMAFGLFAAMPLTASAATASIDVSTLSAANVNSPVGDAAWNYNASTKTLTLNEPNYYEAISQAACYTLTGTNTDLSVVAETVVAIELDNCSITSSNTYRAFLLWKGCRFELTGNNWITGTAGAGIWLDDVNYTSITIQSSSGGKLSVTSQGDFTAVIVGNGSVLSVLGNAEVNVSAGNAKAIANASQIEVAASAKLTAHSDTQECIYRGSGGITISTLGVFDVSNGAGATGRPAIFTLGSLQIWMFNTTIGTLNVTAGDSVGIVANSLSIYGTAVTVSGGPGQRAIQVNGDIQMSNDAKLIMTNNSASATTQSVRAVDTSGASRWKLTNATTTDLLTNTTISVSVAAGATGTVEREAAPLKTVSVGPQSDALTQGTAGFASYDITTANIASGTSGGTVSWFTASDGLTGTSAPTGIIPSVSSVSSDAAYVGMGATNAVIAGTYYFKVTIDGVTSGVSTLVIDPAYTITVNVKKDGAPMDLTGQDFSLWKIQSGSGSLYKNGIITGSTVRFENVTPGVNYRIFERFPSLTGFSTRQQIVSTPIIVSNSDVVMDLNYYSIAYSAISAGATTGGDISGIYSYDNGYSLSGGILDLSQYNVYPAGTSLVLTALGEGATSYVYVWTGAGTTGAGVSGQNTNVLTINSLSGTTNAVCTITGTGAAPTGISVKTQPKLIYTSGDWLDLSALVATLTFASGSPIDVPYADFGSYGIQVTWTGSSYIAMPGGEVGGGSTLTLTVNGYTTETEVLAYYHTVKYAANDGMGSMPDELVETGSNYVVKANAFTRSGYSFTGWNRLANGTGTPYNVGDTIIIREEYTLFAQWTYTGSGPGGSTVGGGGSAAATYTVTFNSNGGSAVASKAVAANAKLAKPADPTKADFIFGGWYTDAALKTVYDFNKAVTSNFTLYAKWTANEAPKGAQPVTPSLPINPFSDVKGTDWFIDDVIYAYSKGLIDGKTATTFAPKDNLTYAEAVKLAACMNQLYTKGEVTLENGSPWYKSYVDYAKNNGIISKDYNWNAPATRAEFMEIFANALPADAYKAINTIADGAIPDVAKNHPNAAAIYKLYRAGIVQGVDNEDHYCNPETNIKRSEVAAVITRMMDEGARIKFSL